MAGGMQLIQLKNENLLQGYSQPITDSNPAKFSVYTAGSINNIKPDPEPWTLSEVYKFICFNTGQIREKIEAIRAELDKDKRGILKSKLPYFTPAGIFHPTRANSNLQSRSGYLVIDDDDHETDTDQRKANVKTGYKPALIFESPSKGLKILYKIDPDQGEHLDYFYALQNYLKTKFGIEADPSGKDISRACYYSWDPFAQYSDNPETLGADFIKQWKPINNQNETPTEPTGETFKDGNRNGFIAKIAGGMHRGGITQTETLETLSKFAEPGFPVAEITATVKSIYNNHEFDAKPAFNKADALKAALLDPLLSIDKPPTIIKINGQSCMTTGALSVVIGRAKARKGFLMGCIAAAAVVGRCSIEGITGDFSNGKTNVLYFDTEQGAYWGHIAYKRILKAVNNNTPKNFQYYDLQQYTPAERLQIIDEAINTTDNLLLVIIDGIRDLISSINDEKEATDMTAKLLKWCAVNKIHVISALHMNKNDFNARGHIGTELMNKAETVISVTKEKDTTISTVKHEFSRDQDFQPFSFIIGDDNLPLFTELSTGADQSTSKEADEISRFQYVFKEKSKLQYKEVVKGYKAAKGVQDSAAKKHTAAALVTGILIQDKNDDYQLADQYKNDPGKKSQSEISEHDDKYQLPF